MPELPEVEIARRNLEQWFRGRRVLKAEADKSRIFRGAQTADFEAVRGKLLKTARNGKYLMLTFEKNRGLLAHLGMTGKFVRRDAKKPEPYSRARFVLDNGKVIHFRDPRMFGRIEPTPADQLEHLPVVRQLGLDALVDEVSAKTLAEAVGRSKQELKVALMDQARVAGLGNIHAAEALYRAKLHPARKPGTLTPAEWKRLAQAIRAAIAFAISRQEGEEIAYVEEPGSENPFAVYGRAKEACRRCGGAIQSFPQGGRTTFCCPRCQPKVTPSLR